MSKKPKANSRRIENLVLPRASPGTQRQLDFIHYGTEGNGRKAYLQAALHADEIPGLLVIHELIHLLDEADRRGQIAGHIVLAPIANPIGLGQHLFGELAGRYDHASAINFNRNYPDLSAELARHVGDQLGDDARSNIAIIRQAAVAIIQSSPAQDETAALKQALMLNAVDADIVIDLHCDWEAVMHLYTTQALWEDAKPLAAFLDARVALLAINSGGHPFDESMSGFWAALAERFPDKSIPNACMAATVELRGKADVELGQAQQDARALFYYLQSQGIISGDAPAIPELNMQATPLDGVEKIVAPSAGVVSYQVAVGERVSPGDVICSLVDISEYDHDKSHIELRASVEGIVFARRLDRLARPGQVLARISGCESLSSRVGSLLED